MSTCSHCDRTLPAADAVCPTCAETLSPTAADGNKAGAHRCPACQQWFARPEAVFEPATAPWYAPRRPACRCPHCSERLRDRTDAHIPPVAFVLFLVAIVAAQNLLPPAAALPAQGVLVATGLAIWAWRRAWGMPAAERYARLAD